MSGDELVTVNLSAEHIEQLCTLSKSAEATSGRTVGESMKTLGNLAIAAPALIHVAHQVRHISAGLEA